MKNCKVHGIVHNFTDAIKLSETELLHHTVLATVRHGRQMQKNAQIIIIISTIGLKLTKKSTTY
jgi:hypothetical protein